MNDFESSDIHLLPDPVLSATHENIPNTIVRRGNKGEFDGAYKGNVFAEQINSGVQLKNESFITDDITRLYLISANSNLTITIDLSLSNRIFTFKRLDANGHSVTFSQEIENLSAGQSLENYESARILLYQSQLFIMNWYRP